MEHKYSLRHPLPMTVRIFVDKYTFVVQLLCDSVQREIKSIFSLNSFLLYCVCALFPVKQVLYIVFSLLYRKRPFAHSFDHLLYSLMRSKGSNGLPSLVYWNTSNMIKKSLDEFVDMQNSGISLLSSPLCPLRQHECDYRTEEEKISDGQMNENLSFTSID